MGFLMSPYPLTNLKYKSIIKMNQDLMVLFQEMIYLKKCWVYLINIDEYADVGTHWIALFCNTNVWVLLHRIF